MTKFENWWASRIAPNVYHYAVDTRELLTVTAADPSPREPDVWLLPAHATFTTPNEERDGYARVFDGTAWGYAKDHRGEVWWRNGEFVNVLTLGEPRDWGCEALTVHDAEYVLPDGAVEARIRMWINSDVIEFDDNPEIMARKVLAAWEAEGETIRPVSYDENDYSAPAENARAPIQLKPEDMEAAMRAAQEAFDAKIDERVRIMVEGLKAEETQP
jgi:hypothetical protein